MTTRKFSGRGSRGVAVLQARRTGRTGSPGPARPAPAPGSGCRSRYRNRRSSEHRCRCCSSKKGLQILPDSCSKLEFPASVSGDRRRSPRSYSSLPCLPRSQPAVASQDLEKDLLHLGQLPADQVNRWARSRPRSPSSLLSARSLGDSWRSPSVVADRRRARSARRRRPPLRADSIDSRRSSVCRRPWPRLGVDRKPSYSEG